MLSIRGVSFASVADAAAALGFSREAIYKAMKKGKLDALGTLPGGRPKKKIVLAGVEYGSAVEAASKIGLSEAGVRERLRRERIEEITSGSVAFYLAGVKYENPSHAARVLKTTPYVIKECIRIGLTSRIDDDLC